MNKYEKYLDKKIKEYCELIGLKFTKTELIEGRHHFLPILLDRFSKIILLKELEEQEKNRPRKQQSPIYSDEDIEYLRLFSLYDLTSEEFYLAYPKRSEELGLKYRRIQRRAYFLLGTLPKKYLKEINNNSTPRQMLECYKKYSQKK